MKKIAILAMASASLALALEKPVPMEDRKPVEIEAGILGNKYRQETRLLQPMSMQKVLANYPESKDAVSSAKLWMYPGLVLGGVGGFLVGYQAVQPVVGGEFNAPMFLGGVGAVGLAVLCGKMSDRKLGQAVGAYNRSLGAAGVRWDITPFGSRIQLVSAF